MRREALECARTVRDQADLAREPLAALVRRWQAQPPSLMLTVARGSSDHAAQYLGYLAMLRLGLPTLSLPMSLPTLHQAPLQVQGQWAIALSQSGGSPDLVLAMQALAARGAHTVSWVNQAASPLEAACQNHLPLGAGPERSVAATKSYLAALALGARWVAALAQDAALASALQALPDDLDAAAAAQNGAGAWADTAVPVLQGAERIMVVGRGLGLAVALEAALKFKETCAIQAEAFSGAEIRHGPMALIGALYPLLIFAPRGPEQAGLLQFAADMRQRGAAVLLAAPADVPERELTLSTAHDALLDPLLAVQGFYLMVETLARARGRDPDAPPFLNKVTLTH
ncbi:SIS domain-containing protein [Amphibiibacter pelophylacis]|uniref:SIS domain-containing protein n=1 Tax=Amphibiibacter pelophylacis TaxID=1799477 RepID=A0ACC6P354_9BURK